MKEVTTIYHSLLVDDTIHLSRSSTWESASIVCEVR